MKSKDKTKLRKIVKKSSRMQQKSKTMIIAQEIMDHNSEMRKSKRQLKS